MVSCRLAAGVELDRPLLRRLRRELGAADALAAAGRVLRRRDVSSRALDERLARSGVSAGARAQAVSALVEAGAVDDRRLAQRRAAFLSDRGWGDEGIRARLESEGLAPEVIDAAIAQLPPEADRAAHVAAKAGDARKAWGLLARRGFDPETIAEVVAALDEGDPSGLG